MNTASKFVDRDFLKTLIPLADLSSDRLDEILSKSVVENYPSGCPVLPESEQERFVCFLLSGQLELRSPDAHEPILLNSRQSNALYPIAHELNSAYSAKTRATSSILFIDAVLLEILCEEYPSGEYDVIELDTESESADWMTKFLQSRIFHSLPTQTIQNLLMHLEEVSVSKNEIIVQQGTPGDYYYIIKQGSCAVLKRPIANADEVKIATLNTGDGFGEEALITNSLRNATVSMLEDGTLMRIGKDDFMTLLVEPLIKSIDYPAYLQEKEKFTLIDIRVDDTALPIEPAHIIAIPFSLLRLRVPTLDKSKDHLVYSENQYEATAAAFLLNQQGLDCRILTFQTEITSKSTNSVNDNITTNEAQITTKQIPQQKIDNLDDDIARHTVLKLEMLNEINRLRTEISTLRKQAETEKETLNSELADVKARATAEAKQQALQDAKLIRQTLLNDKASILAKLQNEINAAKESAVKAALAEAKQEALNIRKSALDEALKIRQRALNNTSQTKEIQENSSLDIMHTNIFDLEDPPSEIDTEQNRPNMPYADDHSLSLRLAEEIKEKLEVIERNHVEIAEPSTRKSTPNASITTTGNKTRFESGEDVFVFIYPGIEADEHNLEKERSETTDKHENIVKLETYKPPTPPNKVTGLTPAVDKSKKIDVTAPTSNTVRARPEPVANKIEFDIIEDEFEEPDKINRTRKYIVLGLLLSLTASTLFYFSSNQQLLRYYENINTFIQSNFSPTTPSNINNNPDTNQDTP